jgi:hypothetical protein
MKRVLYAVALSVGLALVGANVASSHDWGHDGFKPDIDLKPWQFGLGALSGWIVGAGEPGNWFDRGQWGFYLQKHTPDSATYYAAAGATITGGPKPASLLKVLSFDISGVAGETFDSASYGTIAGSTHGYCGAGAPRFNVVSTVAGLCYLGCTYGDRTQDPITGWWTIQFVPPFTQYPGCGGVTGNITDLEIVFDEGTNLGVGATVGSSPGDVVIDNVRINKTYIGKPAAIF